MILQLGLIIGLLRMENEDAVFAMPFPQEPKRFLAIVADGLGGYAGGKIASHLAVDVIRDVLNSYPDHGTIRPLLQKAFKEANAAILQKASQAGELRQMGTTATAIYFLRKKHILLMLETAAFIFYEVDVCRNAPTIIRLAGTIFRELLD